MAKKKRDGMMITQTTDLNWVTLKSKWVFQDPEIRLNASSYSFESIKARELLESIEKKVPVELTGNLTKKIFVGARVKRLFTNPKEGIPYLMPIDLFMFSLKPRKWVRKETEDLENWWVDPFTILITQSGTPGRCLLVNKLFKDKVVSPNVIRVVPNEDGYKIIGYLYAYLNSWIGQTLLTKDQYGATVKHIEPHHLYNIPIPRIPDLEEKINQKILEAHKLREEAQECLLKAEEMIYSELGLPKIDEDDVDYFGGEIGRLVKAFEVKASELDYRLDASYHVPILRLIKKNLKKGEQKGKFQLSKLSELCEDIFIPPRFKRPYVKETSGGVPFLSGSHLIEIKPLDIKYLWSRYKKINLYKVYKNWVLISARGTIGRPYLIINDTPSMAASDNILRIVPNERKVSPSYLTAFLHTSYANYQFQAQKAGSVQDLLQPVRVKEVLVPIPQWEIQDKIGSLVIEAYNKKDKANQIEEQIVRELEETLMKIAGSV